ncbi:hypothetical protein [Thiobacillus sp.]
MSEQIHKSDEQTSLLTDLVKTGVKFLLTGNGAAAALSLGIVSSATSTAIKLAAIPSFFAFSTGLICSAFMLTFYLGYLVELLGNGHLGMKLFLWLTSIFGLVSIIAFSLGVVLAMHGVFALRGTL